MSTINGHNLTPRAQQALLLAKTKAELFQHSYVGTEHITLAILDLNGSVPTALAAIGVSVEKLRDAIKREMGAIQGGPGPVYLCVPPAATPRPDNTFRHYLLADDSVQWFAKIVRVDPERDEAKERGVTEGASSTETIELPSGVKSAFLDNVYSREGVKGPFKLAGDGSSWRAWSLSPAEYQRIKRLIELEPSVREYERLAGYTV